MAVFMKRDRYSWESLPYIRLLSITSSGTQFINTLFNPKYNTRVVLSMSGLPAANAYIFGTRDASSTTDSNLMFGAYRNASRIYSDYMGNRAYKSMTDTTPQMIVDMNAHILKVGDIQVNNTAATSGVCPYPLFIFGVNSMGAGVKNPASYTLDWCEIYDGESLARSYVPAKLKDTEEIGLWDLVENKFYGNSGTGVFTGVVM